MSDVLGSILGSLDKRSRDTMELRAAEANAPQQKRQKVTAHLQMAANAGNLRFPIFPLSNHTMNGDVVSYAKPIEIAFLSRDSNGDWHNDDSELLQFKPPKPDVDLNHRYSEWKHTELGRAELTFEPVMRAIKERVDAGKIPKPVTHFVCWRGNLTKILCAPYSGKEDWEISIYRKNGVLYFDSRETPACQLRKKGMTPEQRLWTYYGYKYENYCVGHDLDSVNTDPGANFNSVVKAKIGNIRMVICGEVDCYTVNPPKDNYLELKTSRIFNNDRGRENFEKNKLLKYWAQSFTIGVPRVLVGFRDENGIVKKNQRFHTLKIPTLMNNREDEMWDNKICINFMHGLLNWVLKTVVDDVPWLLRFDGFGATSVTLKRDVARKPHCIIPDELYDCITAAPLPVEAAKKPSAPSNSVADNMFVGGDVSLQGLQSSGSLGLSADTLF